MSELTPSQVAAWCRQQARKYTDIADLIEGKISSGTVTANQLEEYVRKKSGRVKDLAAHFNVTEQSIRALLEPASRVYIAERGWLKLRDSSGIVVLPGNEQNNATEPSASANA